MANRVAITGLGIISPCGTGKEEFWSNIRAGNSGIERITRFDTEDFPTKVAGEVKNFDPYWHMEPKSVLRTDLSTQFAVNAAMMAADDSGLLNGKRNGTDDTRFGVAVGTTLGGLIFALEQHTILLEKGAKRMNPFTASAAFPNAASSHISIHLKAKGPSYTFSNACTSSHNAIGHAFNAIRDGKMDIMVAGGCEAPIYPTIFSAFCLSRIISTNPDKTPKPFDANRDGIILGEGSGMLIFEEMGHAVKRNANIYAEIIGYSATCDAYHMTSYEPTGEGSLRVVKNALEDAKVSTEEIEYIQAYGNATEVNDVAETAVIKKIFGDYAYKIPITSIKSMTGHTQSASGAVELIASIKSMQENMIPPTINYETPDPNCDLDYVPCSARDKSVRLMISNCFGFGGKNAALVLRKYEN